MRAFLLALFAFLSGSLIATGAWAQATYKYTMTTTVTLPKGSAGEKTPTGLPLSMKISPCSDATKLDQVTFTVKYDAGKTDTDKRDVYVIFHRLDATGAAGNEKFYTLVKVFPGSTAQLNARADVAALTAAATTDIYVKAANNLGGAITETVLGGNIILEGLQAGMWSLVGIVADSTTVDFDDPATWLAWDVAPFLVRKPWEGTANNTCL